MPSARWIIYLYLPYADKRCLRFAVRLPIGWVPSGPLPSSSGLVSTCFKANFAQDFELASQVKSWYDMESYGALKQIDPRSAAVAPVLDILDNTTVQNGKSTMLESCGLKITSNCPTICTLYAGSRHRVQIGWLSA